MVKAIPIGQYKNQITTCSKTQFNFINNDRL